MPKEALPVEFSYHQTYLYIAVRNYGRIAALQLERDWRTKEKPAMTSEDVDYICEKNDEIEQHAIAAVVFSALAAEALINHYAISCTSKNYFRTYLDKRDTLSKWVILQRLTTGNRVDPDLALFQQLRKLMARRNRLVHYKTRIIPMGGLLTSDRVEPEEARESILTVRDLAVALEALDPNVDSKWAQRISI